MSYTKPETKSKTKSEVIVIRVTAKQKQAIQDKAQHLGLSLSDFMRLIALVSKIEVHHSCLTNEANQNGPT